MRVQREELEDEGDVTVGRVAPGDVLPVEQDLAAGDSLQPGDHAQRGGLAAARRAEQHHELAIVDGQVEGFYRGKVAETLLYVA